MRNNHIFVSLIRIVYGSVPVRNFHALQTSTSWMISFSELCRNEQASNCNMIPWQIQQSIMQKKTCDCVDVSHCCSSVAHSTPSVRSTCNSQITLNKRVEGVTSTNHEFADLFPSLVLLIQRSDSILSLRKNSTYVFLRQRSWREQLANLTSHTLRETY